MKTDDGTIPSIITDHIGVYLGCIKGRGNIVAVREDSLVKAFTPAVGDDKSNELPPSLAKSIPDKATGVAGGDSKLESLMGLETLTKPYTTSGDTDAQAKAAEEFKKTMYGADDDGSSSDEEGASKAKKLHIRIRDKPVASATVDVNKIKEATRQFKLGEGLLPSMTMTKSLDLGQNLSQPTPADASSLPALTMILVSAPLASAVSAPGDLFGTDVWTKPAPIPLPGSIVTGMGVTARPIFEDFFKNTIPSLQMTAALSPGRFIERMSQPPKGGIHERPANIPVGTTPASDIGLPDGGVPPQVGRTNAVPFNPISLPDGGIPQQAAPQAVAVPQPQGQVPISRQPLDLTPCHSVFVSVQVQMCSFDEDFLALAMDNSRGGDIKAQATICVQCKIAVTLLQHSSRTCPVSEMVLVLCQNKSF